MSEPSVFIPFICGTCLSHSRLVSALAYRLSWLDRPGGPPKILITNITNKIE